MWNMLLILMDTTNSVVPLSSMEHVSIFQLTVLGLYWYLIESHSSHSVVLAAESLPALFSCA